MSGRGPLTYTLSEFSEGTSERSEQLDAGALNLGDVQVSIPHPVEVSLEITRMREEFRIRGQATLRVSQNCVRCLESVESVLTAPIAMLVRGRHERENESRDAPEGVLYHDGESFSLLNEVRQSVILELPADPFCGPDCKGLCPHCGVNLNNGSCDCAASALGDPRWGVLHNLRQGQMPDH
ncbi:MAG: DUF177 domain-containing protein [Candidatus Eisenbacteria sp.]|nr:DUF177 domain-containing protein [Candidatus Eisenbacteria bacterium]